MVGGRVAVESAAGERRRDRWFFTGMAVAALVAVFIGFAPSYYLGNFFGAPPLSTLVHLHGMLFTSWILVFLTQTSLIAARRTDVHARTPHPKLLS
jgi:cytosine/uracil/thiamine/allantoin permease